MRKGPYANAILRFQIDFPLAYPESPPVLSLLSDVFHPLITPLTTYTYTARENGSETVSAADRDRLPPGGLNLRQGFPEWFERSRGSHENKDAILQQPGGDDHGMSRGPQKSSVTLTVEVLQYLRIVFDTEAILDSIPMEAAANTGAWHAWRSYRSKINSGSPPPVSSSPGNATNTLRERSSSPRQQPGGARRPGEWNWQGVWEDRVRKSIQASISEHALYGADTSDVICFSKMLPEATSEAMPLTGPTIK